MVKMACQDLFDSKLHNTALGGYNEKIYTIGFDKALK